MVNYGKAQPEVLRAKVTGKQIKALHDLLMSLPLEERRELRLRLRAAYLENPKAFVKGLRKLTTSPLDVESVKRWRQSS